MRRVFITMMHPGAKSLLIFALISVMRGGMLWVRYAGAHTVRTFPWWRRGHSRLTNRLRVERALNGARRSAAGLLL